VLVIDDDLTLGRSIVRTLRKHDVTLLTDAAAALARLETGELPDLVLCDLMMPGCSGMELFAKLEHVRPEVLERMVFMTGGSCTAESDRFLEDHGVVVLDKPFETGALEALVGQFSREKN
jgi:CheY-like chemotaxis protein